MRSFLLCVFLMVAATEAAGALAAPYIIGPVDWRIGADTPTFSWQPVAGATQYRVIVQNTNGVAVDVTLSTTEAKCVSECWIRPLNALTAGTSYAWFVNASNDFEMSPWSTGLTFKLLEPTRPPAPIFLRLDGPLTRTPTLYWFPVPGATSYRLLVQNTSGIATDITVSEYEADCHIYASCRYTLNTPLRYQTLYAAFISAGNRWGSSAWSAGTAVDLTSIAFPTLPTPVMPSPTTRLSLPTLQWTPSPNATAYNLLVQNTAGVWIDVMIPAYVANCFTGICSVTPRLRSDVADRCVAYDFHDLCVALPNGTYNFFVSAANGDDSTDWGGPLAFRVEVGSPDVPITLSPEGSIAPSSNPAFVWAAAVGATEYTLLVQNTAGIAINWRVSAENCRAGSCSLQSCLTPIGLGASGIPCLSPATTYAWFVRASNPSGASEWSAGKTIRMP
jgi:hypothetical protein